MLNTQEKAMMESMKNAIDKAIASTDVNELGRIFSYLRNTTSLIETSVYGRAIQESSNKRCFSNETQANNNACEST